MADEVKSVGKYRVLCSAGLTLPVLREGEDKKLFINMELVRCLEIVDCGEETPEMLQEIDKGWLMKWSDDFTYHKDHGIISKARLKEIEDAKKAKEDASKKKPEDNSKKEEVKK